jgi:hypothetical protein
MRIVEIEHKTGIETIVIIDNEDGSETSMLKEIYDRQQAEQSTPNPTGLFNE